MADSFQDDKSFNWIYGNTHINQCIRFEPHTLRATRESINKHITKHAPLAAAREAHQNSSMSKQGSVHSTPHPISSHKGKGRGGASAANQQQTGKGKEHQPDGWKQKTGKSNIVKVRLLQIRSDYDIPHSTVLSNLMRLMSLRFVGGLGSASGYKTTWHLLLFD